MNDAAFAAFDQAASPLPGGTLRLRLFVAGTSLRSRQTIQALRQLCDERIAGRYQLEIIDIYQQPELTRAAQVIATPTLMKLDPQPKKIMIGDLSQTERVLASLGLGG